MIIDVEIGTLKKDLTTIEMKTLVEVLTLIEMKTLVDDPTTVEMKILVDDRTTIEMKTLVLKCPEVFAPNESLAGAGTINQNAAMHPVSIRKKDRR
jgi:hypothetical protein